MLAGFEASRTAQEAESSFANYPARRVSALVLACKAILWPQEMVQRIAGALIVSSALGPIAELLFGRALLSSALRFARPKPSPYSGKTAECLTNVESERSSPFPLPLQLRRSRTLARCRPPLTSRTSAFKAYSPLDQASSLTFAR